MGHRWGMMEPELDRDCPADNMEMLQRRKAGGRWGSKSDAPPRKQWRGSTEGELPQEREALGELNRAELPGMNDG